MKQFFTLLLLLDLNTSYSQWTRVEQLPGTDISALYTKDNTIFAGGRKIVYFSLDKGQTWDSTAPIPQLTFVDNIIVFKNEIYASSFGRGVFKSPDNGLSWQNIGAGIAPVISDFLEWNEDLYAATMGNSLFKLNPANRTTWIPFSNGLSDFSVNATAIAATHTTLVAGTLANGIYDYLAPGSQTWEERLLTGQISPNEAANDIIMAHDSLFIAGSTGRFYLSTDNGLSWTRFGGIQALISNVATNARQAFLVARNFIDIGTHTIFFYLKKDSLDKPFVAFDVLDDHFTYGLKIIGNKLWDASNKGLFFKPLSDLPGITAVDDSTTLMPLPVRFISFNVELSGNKTVAVNWETADGIDIDHYEVERSKDRVHWTAQTTIRPRLSNQYEFIDASPVMGTNYYRIKAVDISGQPFYTSVRSITIDSETVVGIWPNPVIDLLNISINAVRPSNATIRVFDQKGALVRQMNLSLVSGDNYFKLYLGSLARGVYSLRAEWNSGQLIKTVQLLK